MSADKTLLEDLKNLLLQGEATTQEAICSALQAQGHPINQSKVSRLLRKIGALKSKNAQGELVYQLPYEPPPPTISSDLTSLVVDIHHNENMIILHTSPGSAQLIARIIDHHKKTLNILASLAGDDTVLVIPISINQLKDSVEAIKQLLSITALQKSNV